MLAAAFAIVLSVSGLFSTFPRPEPVPPSVIAAGALMQQVEVYVTAVAFSEWLASLPPPASDIGPKAFTPDVTPISGACTGFSVPDSIIQRESGGDPSAYNASSGAIGCTQTLLSHYQAGGACAGDDPYSVDGQRACTATLSDGGTNLAPWSL